MGSSSFMNIQKRGTIMKFFVTSQFSYCLLIWMFHGRRLNNKINSIDERTLRITYQDNMPTFHKLRKKETLFHCITKTCKFWQRKCLKFTEICLQKFQEKHLCPKRDLRRNTFEKWYLKNVKSILHITNWIVIVFRPKNMEFSSSGIEKIREPWLLQIENKELDTLWMSNK